MTPDQVVTFFGGRRKAAENCKVHYQTIYDWLKSGKVPKKRQLFIQEITKGLLKADELPTKRCSCCGQIVQRGM